MTSQWMDGRPNAGVVDTLALRERGSRTRAANGLRVTPADRGGPCVRAALAMAVFFLGCGGVGIGGPGSGEEPVRRSATGDLAEDPWQEVLARLNRDREQRGAESLRRQIWLDEAAAAWGPRLGENGGIEGAMARLASEGRPQERMAAAVLTSSSPSPPGPDSWARPGSSAWAGLLDPDLREIGVARLREDDRHLWVLLAGRSRLDSLAPALEAIEDLERVRTDVVERVNRLRRDAGAPPVTTQARLDAAAQAYAELLAPTSHTGHVGPRGSTVGERVRRAGYDYRGVGENLAFGAESVSDAVEGWFGSPGHRRNLLDPDWTETGLGVAWHEEDGDVRIVWVQVFGVPAS